jgi:integrase
MARPATGSARMRSNMWYARVRLGQDRRSFPLPWCRSEEDASARALLLTDTGRQLLAAAVPVSAAEKLLALVAKAPNERARQQALTACATAAERGVHALSKKPKTPTFKEIGERWTSGKLAARYPDQIRVKRSAHNDRGRFEQHIYPVIGHIPVDQLTLPHCEDVMRKLPSDLAVATRRNIGQLITRLLTLCVYPLKLIQQSPIPRGFLPKAKKRKAFSYLYPDEDRRLMACRQVPFEFRLFYGFLTREGMRSDEATSLTWANVDLDRAAVRLDKNKTDEPRSWALSAGVAEALRVVRKQRPNAKPTDHIFLRPGGMPMASVKGGHLAEWLRKHLRVLGLHNERPELFITTKQRQRIRIHDLRGTFVTVALANGKTETWISDRTGHRSSTMIAAYKRPARTITELALGELLPLNEAIPELAMGPVTGTALGDKPKSSTILDRYCRAGEGIRTLDVNLGKVGQTPVMI